MPDNHRQHPAESDLLRLLDGELRPERAADVHDHLHACWSCRAHYEELKATVGAFVDMIEGSVRPSLPAPPHQWAGFQTQLRAAASQRQRHAPSGAGLSARVARALAAITSLAGIAGNAGISGTGRASVRHFLTSAALAALAGLFIAFVPASPRLSAQVILDHAMAADSRRVAQVTRPVTRQRFEASRRVNGRVVERARWELYHDVQSGRVRTYAMAAPARASAAAIPAATTAAAPAGDNSLAPLAAEVVRLLEAHHWDGGGPLSSASYSRWRQSIGHASTDYTTLTLDDGRAAYRVRARMPEPVKAGAIASAGLVVRADDWHAVRQDLEVRTATGTDDIQITELDFDVLRFDRLAAGIFTDDAPPSTPAPALAAAPRPLSTADLDAAEMSVRYALHRLHADRGEPIQIVRGPSRVTVRGLVDSTARATELEAALGGISGVRVDLTALDRLEAGSIGAPRGGASARQRGARPPTAAGTGSDGVASTAGDGPRTPAAAGATISASAADAAGPVVYADRSVEPPLQAVIDAFLMTSTSDAAGDRGNLAARRNEFVARTLAASDRAMADAWALRRLADRYPQDTIADMPERSSELLEEMVRDYVRGLIVSTSAWRAELSALAPFARARLIPNANANGATNASGTSNANAAASADPSRVAESRALTPAREPWPSYGATMFRVFARAQSLTTDGLVGANTKHAAAPHDAERQLLALLDDLAALEQILRRLDDEGRQGRRLTASSAAPDNTSPR